MPDRGVRMVGQDFRATLLLCHLHTRRGPPLLPPGAVSLDALVFARRRHVGLGEVLCRQALKPGRRSRVRRLRFVLCHCLYLCCQGTEASFDTANVPEVVGVDLDDGTVAELDRVSRLSFDQGGQHRDLGECGLDVGRRRGTQARARRAIRRRHRQDPKRDRRRWP